MRSSVGAYECAHVLVAVVIQCVSCELWVRSSRFIFPVWKDKLGPCCKMAVGRIRRILVPLACIQRNHASTSNHDIIRDSFDFNFFFNISSLTWLTFCFHHWLSHDKILKLNSMLIFFGNFFRPYMPDCCHICQIKITWLSVSCTWF
jgi:hypothetical protein